jgi:pyrroline-5-carboxylate reductase
MKLGFIGTGNMAGAIMGGVIKSNVFKPEEIIGADLFAPGREKVKELYGINVTDSNKEVIEKSEVVIFSVKPQFYADVIQEVKDLVRPEQLIITIAPGKTLAWLAEQFGKDVKIVRTMPNTPAMVGEGMTAATPNEHVTKEELDYACKILSAFGKVEVVAEHMMDAVVAVSGSSPAYVFMFIEAMADAAVAEGMPRAQAYKFAAQAVLGSAKMVLETGKHPGELKDMVCSPAGTTNENLKKMVKYMRKNDYERAFAILKKDHFMQGKDSAMKEELKNE